MRVVAALVALAALVVPAAGQDVELLSEIYGTPLPEVYARIRAGDPLAFEFSGGRAARMRLAAQQASEARVFGGPLAAIGPRQGEVRGTYRVPVVMGLFSDSPDTGGPYTREDAQAAWFHDGPGAITAYYREVSGGRLTLHGDVTDWVRSGVTQSLATLGQSGLAGGSAGAYVLDLLSKVQGVDWGTYDNDGLDGIPNSGDDDGFVDALAVIHPTHGAECGGADKAERIWSHKWSLSSAAGRSFRTATPRANPTTNQPFIRINDYFISPIFSCDATSLNEIGVMTHEIGHAFGLPDLYDTVEGDGKHQGVGNWDLMGTGAWGCDGANADFPCHMGAWSRAVLGWATVVPLAAGVDHGTLTLPPVQRTGTVYRIDATDGSGEYFLLENREKAGFDGRLPSEGLLVWQVSPEILASAWPRNVVNGSTAMGVWLRQADGLNELGIPGRGRGNAGDVFPYTGSLGENRVFHAGSNPSSRSQPGRATGLTILDIQRVGADVEFRLLTRSTTVTVRTEGNAGTFGPFSVDGAPIGHQSITFPSVPFERPVIEVPGGEPISTGIRRPFTHWDDDPAATCRRTLVTPLEDVTLTARYGGREVQLMVALTGGINGVVPATVEAPQSCPGKTDPGSPTTELWFAEGVTARIEARAKRGFQFLNWGGVLAGSSNPIDFTIGQPVAATADFALTYAVPQGSLTLIAATSLDTAFAAVNGTEPMEWRLLGGTLPEGTFISADGRLKGASLETGLFPVTVEAQDAIGLTARGSVVIEVRPPAIGAAHLVSAFLGVGPALTVEQVAFLDRQGNDDSVYDLGDFRAWVLAHPGLSLNAEARALIASFQAGPEGAARVGSGEMR